MTRGSVQSSLPQGSRAVSPSTVLVLDDDPSLRESLSSLFRSVGMRAELYGSASELLCSKLPDGPSCLVLDIRLPEVNGLDIQAQLTEAGIRLPIIFMTGHGDIPMTVRAMKGGAVDFLAKPFRDQDMLDAVNGALDRDKQRRESDRALSELQTLLHTLTAREREVMAYVATGLMNKQIAGEMELSEITVKIHRGRLMKKMCARTLADLVKMAGTLGIEPPPKK
jgi:FixJ family two-component response regulator